VELATDRSAGEGGAGEGLPGHDENLDGDGTSTSETDREERRRREPEPPLEIASEQLKFRSWEAADMERFWPLFRTPRMVKRFVNTYRLIRVRIPPRELAGYEGSPAEPGEYRVVMLLLAVVCGFPNVAPTFLARLKVAPGPGRQSWMEFVSALALDDSPEAEQTQGRRAHDPWDPKPGPGVLTPSDEELGDLRQALLALDAAAPGAFPSDLAPYTRWAKQVARYSFTASTTEV
jgi:hypothetical protein